MLLFSFMIYVLFTFSIYISCYYHLCLLEHLLLCLFILAHLSFSFFFLRYLIINLNLKSFNVTWTTWLLSLALWSCGLLGLRIRSWGLPWDLVTFIAIFPRVLRVYPKTLGYLFALCAGCLDYMFCLWSGIHLYTAVTLSNFCERPN